MATYLPLVGCMLNSAPMTPLNHFYNIADLTPEALIDLLDRRQVANFFPNELLLAQRLPKAAEAPGDAEAKCCRISTGY